MKPVLRSDIQYALVQVGTLDPACWDKHGTSPVVAENVPELLDLAGKWSNMTTPDVAQAILCGDPLPSDHQSPMKVTIVRQVVEYFEVPDLQQQLLDVVAVVASKAEEAEPDPRNPQDVDDFLRFCRAPDQS